MVRLFINIGKKQRVRPGDILGAIAGESGMDGKLIGTIDMYDKYTFVEVPREYAREVLNAMKNVKIKGEDGGCGAGEPEIKGGCEKPRLSFFTSPPLYLLCIND